MGAAHYDITTSDGQVVDLSKMTRSELKRTRRIMVGVYEKHLEEEGQR